MADAPIDQTVANDFLQTIISPEVQYAARNGLVMFPLIRTKIPTQPIKMFQTLQIPTVANFTALDKSAGSDITKEQPATSNVQITINKHKYVGFLLEDFVEFITDADLQEVYSDGMGYALSNVIDSDITAKYSDFTGSAATGGSNQAISADLIRMRKLLNDSNAPKNDRYAVLSSQSEADLLAIDNFVKVNEAGNDAALRKGLLGSAFGFDIYQSNNIVSATSVDQNMFFQKEALGMILANDIRVQTQYKLESMGWLVVSDVVYGLNTLRTTFGRVLQRTL